MTVVFYDIENIIGSFSSYKQKCTKLLLLEPIYDAVVHDPDVEDILEHRAYAWTCPAYLKPEMKELNISFIETKKPVVQYNAHKEHQIKNYADLHIFIDALDFAYTNPNTHCFVLVSHDSDFLVLADKLTSMGKRVIVFNKKDKLPAVFTKPHPQAIKISLSSHIDKTLKSRLKQYKSMDNFKLLVNEVLEKCSEDKTFYTNLCADGVNISSLYQHIQNLSPTKKISYKQTGETKMPLAFAKALSDSRFCVVERENLFYIMARESLPENANIITSPSA